MTAALRLVQVNGGADDGKRIEVIDRLELPGLSAGETILSTK